MTRAPITCGLCGEPCATLAELPRLRFDRPPRRWCLPCVEGISRHACGLPLRAVATLEGYARDLGEVSDHTHLGAIAAALCLLPAPPQWAVDDRQMLIDFCGGVDEYESTLEHLAKTLRDEAESQRVELGAEGLQGPATARDVIEGSEIADALVALAGAVAAPAH